MRWLRDRQKAIEDWLGPFLSGLIEGLAVPVVLGLILWGCADWASLSDPSADLFRDLAQIGVGLFVAFAVATAGASAFSGGDLKDHLNWVGAICGLGVSGFLALGASVALTAYREAGHVGWLDILGLCWVTSVFGLLGIFVAMLPYAAFQWSRTTRSSR